MRGYIMFDKKLLESAELYDKRYKNFATLIIIPIFILFIGLLIFVFFAKKQLTITGTGEIAPVKVVAQIQSTSSNKIIENNLSEGKVIKKNEVLVKYDSASDITQLDSLVQQLNRTQDQRDALTLLQNSLTSGSNKFQKADAYGYYQEYQNYLAQVQSTTDGVSKGNQSINDQNNAANSERNAINGQINTINQQINQYTEIEKAVSNGSGVSGSNPYIGQYNSYLAQVKAEPTQKGALQSQFLASIQSSIEQLQSSGQSLVVQGSGLENSNAYDTSLNSQLASLKAQEIEKANQDMTSFDTNIAELSTKIALQKQADKESIILASSPGVLHVLPSTIGLKAVSAGTTIAEIYPLLTNKSTLEVTAYLSSSDISAVKLGQSLRLSVSQNLPKPLIMKGKITHIDSAPTTENNQNFFKVTAKVVLNRSELSKVRYGLQGKTVIITGTKTYFNYYKDKIMGN